MHDWFMRRSLVMLIGLVAVMAACASETTTTTGTSGPRTPAPTDAPPRTTPGPDDELVWGGPEFTVETFDGERFALGEQRGTPVVINFWESW
jgi:cytochrome oxidase Cu insertion factor (SCO1/SenC/PrrC family)